MNLYDRGTQVLLRGAPRSLTSTTRGATGKAHVGAWTPSTATDQLNQLNVDYGNLDREIKMLPNVPTNPNVTQAQWDAFFHGWNDALSQWLAFYAQNQSLLSITPLNVDSKLSQIAMYRSTLDGWRTQFGQVTKRELTSPTPTTPKIPGQSSSWMDDAAAWWNNFSLPWWATSLATVVVIGGVAYVGYSVYKTHQKVGKDVERFKDAVQSGAEHAVSTALVKSDVPSTGST